MFEIPAEIQTLLKEMQATGDNRPTAELLITGAPLGDVTDPTDWTTWRKFIGDSPVRLYGNMVETADKRAAISYVENNAVYIATASSVIDILAGATTFGTGIKVKDGNADNNIQSSLSLIDGKLRLAITNWEWIVIEEEPEAILQVEYWCDTDGKGTGTFSYVSLIAPDLSSGSNWNIEKPCLGKTLGPITELTTNVWVIMCTHYNYIYSQDTCCYTEDGGATWTHGAVTRASLSNVYTGVSPSILRLSDSDFVVGWASSSDSELIEYFGANGAGVAGVNWGADWITETGNNPRGVSFCTINNKSYMAIDTDPVKIYRLRADIPTIDNITDYADWEYITSIATDAGGHDGGLIFYATTNALILQHTTNNTRISGAGTLRDSVSIPIKSIAIDRSKGGASQAVVVIDNTLGVYAPDSIGDWAHVIWFNKQIQIKMGYGAEQQLVFTGLIDDVYMSNYPAELTIKARDYSKLALDQMPQDDYYEGYAGVPIYAFTYWNKTPEYIFGDMATQAGWATGTVHAEVTGITLARFDTSHEKIADCFQRLCELVGWEWFTDEIGDVYFRPAKDPSAVSVYSFTEGVDIFSLNYRLCDEELYRTIVVWTSDVNGATIKASGTWPAADYNNVLAKKTMIVNAGDIVTDEAGCAAMVTAISNGITPKVREVNFVAVGNPYLQIGDLIRVTETTTCISEYYRITEISQQMNSSGSPIFGTGLKCYHASDFSAEVDPPTPEGSNIVVPDNAEIVGVGGDIQAKIDLLSSLGGGTVTIEDGTFLIDTVSAPILMKSNIKLHLSANTILEALPTAEEHYDVIYCYDITNWEITGGKIIGDRLSHTGATGEFGYGIRVSSCLTYRIADIDLSNCWGDGIIIGGSKPSMLWSEDGYLDNVYSHNNRRQGLSIISVKGLRINSACRFTDTNGTAPQAGIDFEPINPGNFIQGVVIDGAAITNNLGWGIDWWFYHLIGGTNLVTIEIKNCTVTGNGTGQIRYSEGFPENASYKAYLRISVDGVYL